MLDGSRTLSALVALMLAVAAIPAAADPPRRRGATARVARPPSVSAGYVNGGALIHGRHLNEGNGIRYLPGRTLHFGTEELVGLLERSGRRLYRRFGTPLSVGDLSARQGGPAARHRSHQSGRDADLVFFVRDQRGRPVELRDYAAFDGAGRALAGGYRFDTARNWALVEALLTDPLVRPEMIFISYPLRARLLQWARSHGASATVVARAQRTLLQPRHVHPHDNHFHVRIGCPAGDRGCQEGTRPHRPPRRRAVAAALRAPHPRAALRAPRAVRRR